MGTRTPRPPSHVPDLPFLSAPRRCLDDVCRYRWCRRRRGWIVVGHEKWADRAAAFPSHGAALRSSQICLQPRKTYTSTQRTPEKTYTYYPDLLRMVLFLLFLKKSCAIIHAVLLVHYHGVRLHRLRSLEPHDDNLGLLSLLLGCWECIPSPISQSCIAASRHRGPPCHSNRLNERVPRANGFRGLCPRFRLVASYVLRYGRWCERRWGGRRGSGDGQVLLGRRLGGAE